MSAFVITQKKVDQCDLTTVCQNGIRARIIVLTTLSVKVSEYNSTDPDGLIVYVNDEDDKTFVENIENNGMYANPIDDDEIRFVVEWGSFNHHPRNQHHPKH